MKLLKEIRSKDGVLHFQRYLLFATPWFHCYLHKIYEGDKDLHLHNHPWHFFGVILRGCYIEETESGNRTRGPLSYGGGDLTYFHKILTVVKPVTSLFFVGINTYEWGYKTSEGIIESEKYRERKRLNRLPK